MVDESGDQFVAYFLPTEETIKKRKRDQDACQDYDPEDTYVLPLTHCVLPDFACLQWLDNSHGKVASHLW